VQDPRAAEAATMVEAALARITVDWTLTLDGIAALLSTVDEESAA
jgi:hypothetical protein